MMTIPFLTYKKRKRLQISRKELKKFSLRLSSHYLWLKGVMQRESHGIDPMMANFQSNYAYQLLINHFDKGNNLKWKAMWK